MAYVSVDVERDHDCIPIGSIVCFGAVIVDKNLDKTFYGKMAPISDVYNPGNLKVSGFTREQHLKFDAPKDVMLRFSSWLEEFGGARPSLISDCLTGDWEAINWYFHNFTGKNPFGYSGRRISDIICGMNNDMRTKWKHKKSQDYIHDPVFDAIQNAEVFLNLRKEGLKI